MKKITFLSVAIAAAGLLLYGMLNSCGKEEIPNNINENIQDFNLHQNQKINTLIKSFLREVANFRENAGYKNSGSIDCDSALWFLEAGINYAHAFPNRYYTQYQLDTTTLSLSKNGEGKIDLDHLASKYYEMKELVSGFYYNSGFENKGLAMVDLSQVNYKDDALNLQVVTITGENTSQPPGGIGISGPFEAGDNWWYGQSQGKCDDPSYLSDAADQLRIAMNSLIPDPAGNYYFINQFTVTRYGGEDNTRRPTDPEPPDNVYDYYLYFASTQVGTVTDDILCLDYNEMNFYFSYLKTFLYTKLPDDLSLPTGYEIETIIEISGYPEPINSDIKYLHRGRFQYGKKVFYNNGEGPAEL